MPDEALSLSERRVASWLLILTAVAYAYFFAGGGWNQNSQFDLTRAMVEQRTFRIDRYAHNTGDVSTYAGHIFSNKSPGLSLLAAFPYAICYAVERSISIDVDDVIVQTLNCYLCTFIVCGLLGASVPFLLFRHARSRGEPSSPVWAATIALIVGLATQMWPYSTTLMTAVPTAALLFAAFLAAIQNRSLTSGAVAGIAAATNYLCVPLLCLFPLLLPRRRRNAALFFGGALPSLLFLAIYQKICCGGFLTTPMSTMDQRFVNQRAILGIIKLPSLEAAWGITISPYRGLFYFAPVLVMGIGGAILWLRSRREWTQLAAISAISAFFFAFNVTFNGWEGGFGIGARYLVPLIPLFGLLMLELRGFLRPLTVALAVLSVLLNFAAVAVDPQPSGTIPRPVTQYILPLLLTGHFSPDIPITPPWSAATFTGHTSVNRLTVDEAIPFTRHPPGSPASEWASFNLGEPFFGAGSAMSLLPIGVILMFGAAAILRKARKA
jgi:hypothetical protein